MAHDCPECGQQCYCNGDIDDINMGECDECICCMNKEHDDDDEYEDDEDWYEDIRDGSLQQLKDIKDKEQP